MAAVGGDIVEITYNHPTLGSGTLFPKASEDSTYDLGGPRGNDDANMVTGNGQTIRQLNNVRWTFEVTLAWDMNSKEDLEKLTKMAGDPDEADWTFSHINGTIYSGKGSPVGDIKGNGNTSTTPLKVSGGGKLKKIG